MGLSSVVADWTFQVLLHQTQQLVSHSAQVAAKHDEPSAVFQADSLKPVLLNRDTETGQFDPHKPTTSRLRPVIVAWPDGVALRLSPTSRKRHAAVQIEMAPEAELSATAFSIS